MYKLVHKVNMTFPFFLLQTNKEYLQKSVKEHEDNIREMLASRPK